MLSMHRPWVQPLPNKNLKFLVCKKSETLRSLKNKNNKEHIQHTQLYQFPSTQFQYSYFPIIKLRKCAKQHSLDH